MVGLGFAEDERFRAAPPLGHGFRNSVDEVGHAGLDAAEGRGQGRRHGRAGALGIAGQTLQFCLHVVQRFAVAPLDFGDPRLDLKRHLI